MKSLLAPLALSLYAQYCGSDRTFERTGAKRTGYIWLGMFEITAVWGRWPEIKLLSIQLKSIEKIDRRADSEHDPAGWTVSFDSLGSCHCCGSSSS